MPLADFSLTGGKRSGLRQTLTRGQRDGSTFEVIGAVDVAGHHGRAGDDLGRLDAVQEREREGLLARPIRPPDYLAHFPVAVIRNEGRIVAFANLWATPDKRELSIDLMRYTSEAPREVMDHLFVELMLWGKAAGLCPLRPRHGAAVRPRAAALAPLLSRAGAALYQHGEHFYNFEGLRRYKEKFRPVWEPRYLAAPGGIAMARVLADATLLIGGGLRGVLGRS